MLIRTHMGVSLDGLVASADGLPAWDWSPGFTNDSPPQGYPEFMENVGGVIMGRTSFEQGLPMWRDAWPWGESPVRVISSRPLGTDVPATVKGARDPSDAVEQMRSADVSKDVQLLGGPSAIESFMQAGLLDELGLVFLPILLGEGIPLFDARGTSFSADAWQASPKEIGGRSARSFSLKSQKTFPDGAVWMVYATK